MLVPRTGSRRLALLRTRPAALWATIAAAAETIGIPSASLTPAEVREPLGSARVFKIAFHTRELCSSRPRKQLHPMDATKRSVGQRVQNIATALMCFGYFRRQRVLGPGRQRCVLAMSARTCFGPGATTVCFGHFSHNVFWVGCHNTCFGRLSAKTCFGPGSQNACCRNTHNMCCGPCDPEHVFGIGYVCKTHNTGPATTCFHLLSHNRTFWTGRPKLFWVHSPQHMLWLRNAKTLDLGRPELACFLEGVPPHSLS